MAMDEVQQFVLPLTAAGAHALVTALDESALRAETFHLDATAVTLRKVRDDLWKQMPRAWGVPDAD